VGRLMSIVASAFQQKSVCTCAHTHTHTHYTRTARPSPARRLIVSYALGKAPNNDRVVGTPPKVGKDKPTIGASLERCLERPPCTTAEDVCLTGRKNICLGFNAGGSFSSPRVPGPSSQVVPIHLLHIYIYRPLAYL
jgi:hypothetical protein